MTMPRTLSTAIAGVVLLAVGVAACAGGGSPDLAGDVCKKADTCGALSGINVGQCKDLINTSLNSMPSDARGTSEKAYGACLDMMDCTAFNACIVGVMQGTTTGTAGTTGTGGTSGGGTGGSAIAGTGGSSAGGTGGTSAGGTGGTSAGGTTGTGGTSAAGAAGTSAAGTGGGSGGAIGGRGGGAAGTTGTGGSATGGTTGTGGGSAALELMTSAQNAYWVAGQVTKVTSGTADLAVDKNTTYQRWDGFGGCFNEMGWDALSVLPADQVTNAMKLLFDATAGANFAYGRLPMGASDYATSWYTLDDTANNTPDYTMASFSIARDRMKLIPFIKAAVQVKPNVRLWASPWVVPGWMMSGSNMKTDAQTLGAHALYMARFVEEYAKEGLTIWAVHPQNEPGYARVHWTQAGLIDFMKTYLGPTFAQRNLTAEVWCGTMSKDPDDTNIAKATAMDTAALKYVKGFGVQWNLQPAVMTLAAKGPVMQTEHRCGNYNFDSPYWDKMRYSSTMPQNDHLYGEESWQLIRDWIVSGVNSYSAWNMVLDTVGKSLDNWPQNALLTVDRTAKKLNVTPAYYVFRHYSQYIAVGATRIGTTGSTDALAFKNPDGSIIVQVYNKGTSSKRMIVGIGSALSQSLYQFDVPAHGWDTLRVPQ
jgi:glucosylceramidase